MYNKKLELFGYEIGQYLENLNIKDNESLVLNDNLLEIKINHLVITKNISLYEIKIVDDNKFVGTLFIDCFKNNEKFSDSRISEERELKFIIRKFQESVVRYLDDIQLVIEQYVIKDKKDIEK